MLSQQQLKKLLYYNPKTGIFTWLYWQSSSTPALSVAGSIDKVTGYCRIIIKGKNYPAHRLAFLYMKGYLPENQVDHKNGKPFANWWKNLREASAQCNAQNSKIYSNNTSGYKGVFWCKHRCRWRAQITIANKRISIKGIYSTALEAAIARMEYELKCDSWHCDIRQEGPKLVLKAMKKAGRKKERKKLKKRLKNKIKATAKVSI